MQDGLSARFWYYVRSPRDLGGGAKANKNNMADDDTRPEPDNTRGDQARGAVGTRQG